MVWGHPWEVRSFGRSGNKLCVVLTQLHLTTPSNAVCPELRPCSWGSKDGPSRHPTADVPLGRHCAEGLGAERRRKNCSANDTNRSGKERAEKRDGTPVQAEWRRNENHWGATTSSGAKTAPNLESRKQKLNQYELLKDSHSLPFLPLTLLQGFCLFCFLLLFCFALFYFIIISFWWVNLIIIALTFITVALCPSTPGEMQIQNSFASAAAAIWCLHH